MKPNLNGTWVLTIRAPYDPEAMGQWTVFTRKQDDEQSAWEYLEQSAWEPNESPDEQIRSAEYYFALRNGWDFLIDNPTKTRLTAQLMEVVASTHPREPRGFNALGEQLDDNTLRSIREHNLPTH